MGGSVSKILKKELAWCMCVFHNAHIDSFREGIRSSRNVQLGGVVNFLGIKPNSVQV